MHTVLFPVNTLGFGGAEQQLLALVRGLDKRRFHPIVAPLYPGELLESAFQAVPGVEVVNLNRHSKYDPSPLWKLARLIRSRRVDIVQPFLSPATFFGLLPSVLLGVPVKVVTERSGARVVRSLGYRSYVMAEDWLTRFASVAVANSGAGRDMLIERGIPIDRTRVIYNGVNLDRLEVDRQHLAAVRAETGVPRDGKVIGILASLTPAKDHATLIRAIARLAPDWPGLRLAIIGTGPLHEELQTLALELAIAGRVTFFGYQTKVADFLAACDFLVSSSCDNEGCSNSILEAMAIGLPIVATDIGGNRELVEDGVTGFLAPARDPGALAAAIQRALIDPAATSSIADRGQQSIHERFSMARMVADYETLYTALLEAAGRQTSVSAQPAHTEAQLARNPR